MPFFFFTVHNPVSVEYFPCKLNDTEYYLMPQGIILNQENTCKTKNSTNQTQG